MMGPITLRGPLSRPSRAACLLIAAIAIALLTLAASPALGAPTHRVHPAFGQNIHMRPAGTAGSGGTFHCQSPSATYNCYGPAQMRAAYNIQSLLDAGKDGAGQTITIIDAFQHPTMASDLARFDSAFGLAAPPSFKTVAPFGLTPFDASDPNQVGWSSEIALDVEWAHAIAPRANIVLALSPSNADADVLATEQYVVQHKLGNVVSMSYGEAEQCMDPKLRSTEQALFAKATSQGTSLFAASGDFGAAQLSCDENSYVKDVSTPASDPNVTGVGGTDLKANLSSGAYNNESVWNEPVYPIAGGGGFSSLYSRPDFQKASSTDSRRGVPDVAYSASSVRGVLVVWTAPGDPDPIWVFGGTSAGTPQWAAICAIADQAGGHALGNINAKLYGIDQKKGVTFHDIATGNNDLADIRGYTAKAGWDAASGLGSPVVDSLVPALLASR